MKYLSGNLLDVKYGIIVHGCNAQGVMGSGVALVVKNKYPEAYNTYRRHIDYYNNNQIKLLGSVAWHHISVDDTKFLTIANAITQIQYGKDGKKYASYDAIYDSFECIIKFALKDAQEIHIPYIGCGLGGLNWKVVRTLIESVCDKLGYDHDKITVWEL